MRKGSIIQGQSSYSLTCFLVKKLVACFIAIGTHVVTIHEATLFVSFLNHDRNTGNTFNHSMMGYNSWQQAIWYPRLLLISSSVSLVSQRKCGYCFIFLTRKFQVHTRTQDAVLPSRINGVWFSSHQCHCLFVVYSSFSRGRCF